MCPVKPTSSTELLPIMDEIKGICHELSDRESNTISEEWLNAKKERFDQVVSTKAYDDAEPLKQRLMKKFISAEEVGDGTKAFFAVLYDAPREYLLAMGADKFDVDSLDLSECAEDAAYKNCRGIAMFELLAQAARDVQTQDLVCQAVLSPILDKMTPGAHDERLPEEFYAQYRILVMMLYCLIGQPEFWRKGRQEQLVGRLSILKSSLLSVGEQKTSALLLVTHCIQALESQSKDTLLLSEKDLGAALKGLPAVESSQANRSDTMQRSKP